jgi:hypothetical protein
MAKKKQAARRSKTAPRRKVVLRDLATKRGAAKHVTGGLVIGKGPLPA